jgi:hypothetical protein
MPRTKNKRECTNPPTSSLERRVWVREGGAILVTDVLGDV